MKRFRSVFGFVLWVALSFGAGAIGSVFTQRAIPDWYMTLAKPSFTPPSAVFGPVWSLLYFLMGTAAWLVWKTDGSKLKSVGLALFLTQLVFNAGWSILFFGLHLIGAAFAEIIALWALILATTVVFWSVRSLAGWLMVPYLVWVSFAAVLNFSIWRLNI